MIDSHHTMVLFISVGFENVLTDIESGGQSENGESRAVRSAPEVVELEAAAPQTSISRGRREDCVFFIKL